MPSGHDRQRVFVELRIVDLHPVLRHIEAGLFRDERLAGDRAADRRVGDRARAAIRGRREGGRCEQQRQQQRACKNDHCGLQGGRPPAYLLSGKRPNRTGPPVAADIARSPISPIPEQAVRRAPRHRRVPAPAPCRVGQDGVQPRLQLRRDVRQAQRKARPVRAIDQRPFARLQRIARHAVAVEIHLRQAHLRLGKVVVRGFEDEGGAFQRYARGALRVRSALAVSSRQRPRLYWASS